MVEHALSSDTAAEAFTGACKMTTKRLISVMSSLKEIVRLVGMAPSVYVVKQVSLRLFVIRDPEAIIPRPLTLHFPLRPPFGSTPACEVRRIAMN